MASTSGEKILAYPVAFVESWGLAPGFNPVPDVDGLVGEYSWWLTRLMAAQPPDIVLREEVENNPAWRQLVVYTILETDNGVFAYQRKGDQEKRLSGKWSIGVGGHCIPRDCMILEDLRYPERSEEILQPYSALLGTARTREVWEEIDYDPNIQTYKRQGWLGVIDEREGVGLDHIGFVSYLHMEGELKPTHNDWPHWGVMSVEQLRIAARGFESWSQMCIASIYGGKFGLDRRRTVNK